MKNDNATVDMVGQDKLDSTFDFVAKELDFLAAFSAVSGAVAAWLANATLLKKSADQPDVLHSTLVGAPRWITPIILVKVAGLALGATAILALLQRGKIARNYGQLVVDKALGKAITPAQLKDLLPRSLDDLFRTVLHASAWRAHWSITSQELRSRLGFLQSSRLRCGRDIRRWVR
jgi:hypothetical protein